MISETKLDESFPVGQFLMDGHSVPYRFDRDGNDGGILLYIRRYPIQTFINKSKY